LKGLETPGGRAPSSSSARSWITWVVASLFAATLALAGAPTADAQTQPNILVVLTDDQPLETSIATPRIAEWFADGGTEFTSAYVTDPLCCPSRASILSGRYPHNHGVEGNRPGQGKEDFDHELTIQGEIGDAGYRTGYVGKYQLEPRSAPGFDAYAITRGYFDRPLYTKKGRQGKVAYAPRFVFRRAGNFAERWSPEPWMIVVSPSSPHQPNEPESRHLREKFPWDRPPNVQAPPQEKPAYVEDSQTNPKDGAQLRQRQLRTLRSADDGFMGLVGRLTDLGQIESTVVIFLSDNGILWGQHGLIGKHVPYQESVRVPAYARGPGVPAGRSERLVANVDLAPTLYRIAGVEPSYEVDGRDMLVGPARETLLLEHLREHVGGGGKVGLRGMPAWASLVSADDQYVAYESGEEELYDLEADLFQLENLAPGADLGAYRALLAEVRACAGEECP